MPEPHAVYDDEIELMDILRVLWKRKVFIVSVVVVTVLSTYSIISLKYPLTKTVGCVVSLNFKGIEKHTYPDGSLFIKNQIIRPEIIAAATRKFDEIHERPVKELFETGFAAVDVEEIIPAEIQKKIADAEKKGDIYEYYPNIFRIKITTHKEDTINDSELKEFISEIINEYKTSFKLIYGNTLTTSVDFPEGFLENYEYLDVVTVLKKNANQLVEFLTSKVKIAGYYVSKKSGNTFVDIKNKVEIVKGIYISRIEAIIKNSKITRDKESLVNIYQNRIRNLSLNKDKKDKEAEVSYKLLTEMGAYKNITSSGSIRSEDSGSGMLLDSSILDNIKKDNYISYLLKRIIEAETKSIESSVEIEFLRNDIDSIQKSVINNEQKQLIEKDMAYVTDKLIEYSILTNELNTEFLQETINGSIKVVRAPQVVTSRAKNLKMIIVLSVVASGFLAVFAAFFIEYVTNHRQKEKTTDDLAMINEEQRLSAVK